MNHTEPPRPSNCEKCGCPNFSYDSRPPSWQFIVLQYVGIWLCIKCIPASKAVKAGTQLTIF